MGSRIVVDVATVGVHAVGDCEIRCLKHQVIAQYLVEDRLINRYRGRLVFYNHPWATTAVIDYSITPSRGLVEGNADFIAHQSCRISFAGYKEVDKMLAHPLLGGKCHEPSPQRVQHTTTLTLVVKV